MDEPAVRCGGSDGPIDDIVEYLGWEAQRKKRRKMTLLTRAGNSVVVSFQSGGSKFESGVCTMFGPWEPRNWNLDATASDMPVFATSFILKEYGEVSVHISSSTKYNSYGNPLTLSLRKV